MRDNDIDELYLAFEGALRREREMFDNLTLTQARCTELLEEVRRLRTLYRNFAAPALSGSLDAVRAAVRSAVGPRHSFVVSEDIADRCVEIVFPNGIETYKIPAIQDAVQEVLPPTGMTMRIRRNVL